MYSPAESTAEKSKQGAGMPPTFAKPIWLRFVEIWIFLVIVTFFLIRVLGSHTFQRLASGVGHRHLS